MNKKKIIVFCLCAFCLCVLCICAFVLCSNSENDNPHISKVLRPINIQEYGPYVFWAHGKVWKYNRFSNILTGACIMPDCDGSGPLDGAITNVNRINNDALYFSSFTAYTHTSFVPGAAGGVLPAAGVFAPAGIRAAGCI